MALRIRRPSGGVPPDGGNPPSEPPFDPSVLGEVSGMMSVASRTAPPEGTTPEEPLDLAPAQDSSPFDLASPSLISADDLSERLAEAQISIATLEEEILTAKQTHVSDLNLIEAVNRDALKAREDLVSQKAINEGISRLHDEAEATLAAVVEELAKTKADLQRVTEEHVLADVRAKRYRNERNDERERVRAERAHADTLEKDLEALRGEKDILVRNYDALLLERKNLARKIFVLEARAPFAAMPQPAAPELIRAPSPTPLERFQSFVARTRRAPRPPARGVMHQAGPSQPTYVRTAVIALVALFVLATCGVLIVWGVQALSPTRASNAAPAGWRTILPILSQQGMYLLREHETLRGCVIVTGDTATVNAWKEGSFIPVGTITVSNGDASLPFHANEAWGILDAAR